MARSRNIKPGFFKNEDLAECSLAARLCFAGLWTLADREGRLEDRPKRIKGELFAYDSFDVEPLLVELARHGFIVRYEIDGERCIQIPRFLEHQAPHYSEKPSVIKPQRLPESERDEASSTPGTLPEHSRKKRSLRGGRNPLIPSSLIPSSLIPDSGEETKPAIAGSSSSPSAEDRPRPALRHVNGRSPDPPDCPHAELLALWAEVLPALPQHDPQQWRGARADHLRARWRETAAAKHWADREQGLGYFRKLFGYVGQSPFLTGHVTSRDPSKRPFAVELAWLVKPENWAKTVEGKYHPEESVA